MYYIYLGDMYNNLKKFHQAKETYDKCLELIQAGIGNLSSKDIISIYIALASIHSNLLQADQALPYYKKAYELDSNSIKILSGYLAVKRELCDWTDWDVLMDQLLMLTKNDLANVSGQITPYDTLFLGQLDNQYIKLNNKEYTRLEILKFRTLMKYKQPYYKKNIHQINDDNKIKIAYISRRFEAYAGAQLMLRLYELHDRNKFIVYAFSTGANNDSIEIYTRKCRFFYDLSNYNIKMLLYL